MKLLFILFTSLSALAHSPYDVLESYQDKGPKGQINPAQTLIYYNQVEKLIRDKLKLKLSQKEASILKALKWVIIFADKDINFDFLSSNFLIFLHEMTLRKERKHQKEVAELFLKTSLARAYKKLESLYPKTSDAAWKFIALLPITEKYPEFKQKFRDFYTQQFASLPKAEFEQDKINYSKAIKNKSYQAIYDYLISASFLHYYLQNSKTPVGDLPEDYFLEALKELEVINYDLNLALSDMKFIDLGYLATHVMLVLTNYGSLPIKDSLNKQKAQAYIEATLNKVRHELGYLDLLAEYIQCLKIVKPDGDLRIAKFEKLLFDLQRNDGSWGNEESINADPYTAFHPTWAVLTALNQ